MKNWLLILFFLIGRTIWAQEQEPEDILADEIVATDEVITEEDTPSEEPLPAPKKVVQPTKTVVQTDSCAVFASAWAGDLSALQNQRKEKCEFPNQNERGFTLYDIAGLRGKSEMQAWLVKERLAKEGKYSTSLIKLVQSGLRLLDYDAGVIDGKFNAKTQNAIKSFQQKNNFSQTGRIHPAWLSRFYPQLARKMQQELNKQGFSVGTPDGTIGSTTREAMALFRTTHKLPNPDYPHIDDQLVYRLLTEGGDELKRQVANNKTQPKAVEKKPEPKIKKTETVKKVEPAKKPAETAKKSSSKVDDVVKQNDKIKKEIMKGKQLSAKEKAKLLAKEGQLREKQKKNNKNESETKKKTVKKENLIVNKLDKKKLAQQKQKEKEQQKQKDQKKNNKTAKTEPKKKELSAKEKLAQQKKLAKAVAEQKNKAKAQKSASVAKKSEPKKKVVRQSEPKVVVTQRVAMRPSGEQVLAEQRNAQLAENRQRDSAGYSSAPRGSFSKISGRLTGSTGACAVGGHQISGGLCASNKGSLNGNGICTALLDPSGKVYSLTCGKKKG